MQSITPFREGAEFTVFRAVIGTGVKAVLKTAPHEDISNANDPSRSARALLHQEEHLGRYLRSQGIPVPISLGLVTDGPYPCLIQELVEHDESCEVSDGHLAPLLSRIHACTAPRTPVAHEGLPFASCIARRIARRAHELEKATGVSFPVPDTTRIESVLKLRGYRPSLLHMDIRPPNILATAGSIRAIVDWSNALMGDPAPGVRANRGVVAPMHASSRRLREHLRTTADAAYRRPSLSPRRGSGPGASAFNRAA
ncbi:MAG: aminoglycoside phosphotransferase family protein [Spirochaetaceae bacterium]|nr:aminoglycoside phosphotransferase family protein [Spirochaetaceae bacterium]